MENNQSLRIGYNLSVPGTRWMDGYWGMNSYNYWFPSKSLKVDPMAYDHFVLPFNYVSNLVFEEEMIPLCNYRQNATVVGSAKVRGMAKAEAGMSIVISDKADVEYAETADADRDTGAGETLPGATEELRTNLPRPLSFIRNFVPMSKGKFLSLSPCRRALPVGISGDMRIPKE